MNAQVLVRNDPAHAVASVRLSELCLALFTVGQNLDFYFVFQNNPHDYWKGKEGTWNQVALSMFSVLYAYIFGRAILVLVGLSAAVQASIAQAICIMLAYNFVVAIVLFLRFSDPLMTMGPLIKMIFSMLDARAVSFLIILAMVAVAFSIALSGIEFLSESASATQSTAHFGASVLGNTWNLVWALVGDTDGDETHGIVRQALVWVYLLLTQIVLINLLQALFNDTYEVTMAKASHESVLSRVNILHQYKTARSIWPPPFSIGPPRAD